jgi:hypothetical protein
LQLPSDDPESKQSDELVPSYGPGRKTTRARERKPSLLTEQILIREWKKNRGPDVIRVTLRSYKDTELVDIRTWANTENGECLPGKGFAAHVRHVPQLIRALHDAHKKLIELGLIGDGGGT